MIFNPGDFTFTSVLVICLFFFGGGGRFIVPLENFSYGDVTITGEGLSKTNIPPPHHKNIGQVPATADSCNASLQILHAETIYHCSFLTIAPYSQSGVARQDTWDQFSLFKIFYCFVFLKCLYCNSFFHRKCLKSYFKSNDTSASKQSQSISMILFLNTGIQTHKISKRL